MAAKVARGEVWIVDLGMVAKIRPCLVLRSFLQLFFFGSSITFGDEHGR